MRVLQIISSLSSGGAEVFVAQLTAALSTKCDVKLLTYAGELDKKGVFLKEYLQEKGVDYKTLNAKSYISRLMVPFSFAKEIKKFKPDVVHVHLTRSEQFLYLSSLISGKKYKSVRTKHDETPYPEFILNKYINNYFDFNIACSSSALDPLIDLGLSDKSKIINNGVDLSAVVQSDPSDEYINNLKEKLSIPLHKKVFINIGRMHKTNDVYQKSQDLIIRSLNNLKNTNDVHVLFLGDGNGREYLEGLASECGVDNYVRFVGVVDDVFDYLICSDIFLMPSRWEGLPISAIEAACFGMPMLVTDIKSFKLFDAGSVVKCKNESTHDLSLSIDNMIEHYDQYKSLVQKDKDYFRSMFSIDNVSDNHIKVYRDIV